MFLGDFLESYQDLFNSPESIKEFLKKTAELSSNFPKLFREQLVSVGAFVDVKDSYNKWRVASITSLTGRKARVTFDALESKWDEV